MLIDFRELFPKYNIKPRGVIHIGGNRGEEIPIYLELGIDRQLWFEGNPEICLKLQENLANNPNAYAYNYCVGNENRKVTLHISNNDGQSSSILELGTHKTAHPEVKFTKDVEVEMIRIEDYIYKGIENYDFLNIDIQGYELEALKGMGDMLHDIKWAYLEVNKEPLYVGCALVEEIDAYLEKYGFARVETKWCGNTGWGDACFIKL
jgi:FkbM family methyltransferase